MAALMSTEMGATDKTVFNVTECRRAGIPLLAPDVNRSQLDFSVEDFEGKGAIRFGLGAVKNVGLGAVESMLISRSKTPGGRFASLEAFCDAVDWSAVNKRVAESLAKAGALDGFGERAAVLASIEPLIGSAQQRQKAAARGQMDLFGGVPDVAPANASVRLTDVPAADRKQVLTWEKELLGLYLSSHPLMDLTGQGVPDGFSLVSDIMEKAPGTKSNLIGMVIGIRRITTKNNRTMAVMEVEDLTGTIEVVAFPDSYEQHSEMIREDAILSLQAKVDKRGEKRQLILEQASEDLPAPRLLEKTVASVVIVLPSSAELWQDINAMQAVDDILSRHEGPQPVEFHVTTGTDILRLRSRTRKVEWSEGLESELLEVLGGQRVFVNEPETVDLVIEEDDARILQEVA
jgi:DNA polymerase-3 subunit alpha